MNTPDSKPEIPPEAAAPEAALPDNFFSRWSQRKQLAREQAQESAAVSPLPAPTTVAEEAPPQLPPVEQLGTDSDYRGFLHPKVDEGLRRAALKKLFSDPHFNVMDGLDTYIDDYSISEPIPEAMMAQLKHAQSILAHSRERREAEAARVAAEERAAVAGAVVPAIPASPATADAGVVTAVTDIPHDGPQTT